jgi:hypothetical protein|nr:hypothetical protein [Bradyrhizobium sp.]
MGAPWSRSLSFLAAISCRAPNVALSTAPSKDSQQKTEKYQDTAPLPDLTLSVFIIDYLTWRRDMSDGPHKSLPMRDGWRKLAKRAANTNFEPTEISEAIPGAINWTEQK